MGKFNMPLGYAHMAYQDYMPIGLVFVFWDIPKQNTTLLRKDGKNIENWVHTN